jgi:hypothetical protein
MGRAGQKAVCDFLPKWSFRSLFYGEPSLPKEADSLPWNRIRTNARFARALKAITDCQKQWMVESDLAGLLAIFAFLAVSPNRRGYRKLREKVWPPETGKTWKVLKGFPDRLRKMAKEVERLNVSVFFAPATHLTAKTPQAEVVRRRFEGLPGCLRVYAEYVRRCMERLPAELQAALSWAPKKPLSLLFLSTMVKAATGKWYDREVAELLNAAAIALDEKGQFDYLTIAQARYRWKKKKT